MKLGLSLTIGSQGPSGPSEPVSLYDTADMVVEGTAGFGEVLGADSFRGARTASGNTAFAISGVPSGNYIVTGTLAAYDGAIVGVTMLRVSVRDNNTQRSSLTAAGAFTTGSIPVTSGTLRFALPVSGDGFRINSLFVEAA